MLDLSLSYRKPQLVPLCHRLVKTFVSVWICWPEALPSWSGRSRVCRRPLFDDALLQLLFPLELILQSSALLKVCSKDCTALALIKLILAILHSNFST